MSGTEDGVRKLEVELERARANGARLGRALHQAMSSDLRAANERATRAEKEAQRARRRADRAEAKLAAVRTSTTWKAGNVLVAVPRAAKRALRRPSP